MSVKYHDYYKNYRGVSKQNYPSELGSSVGGKPQDNPLNL